MGSSQARKKIILPDVFEDIFKPYRYKVFYGGRGGAKSHNIARYLLIEGARKPMRFLCARELQGSIHDSVHKLLSDIIAEYELNSFYEVQQATIKGANGTEFFFKGLKHNATEIKSMEGVDKVWVEEAERVSSNSWEILIPTIRKPNSEIIISFNPKHPTDPTYERFVANADESMLVKKVSWQDNPFFPEVLNEERQRMQRQDPIAYQHVWEGDFDERHFGGIYANYVDTARGEDRITNVPHKDGCGVITAWDLGRSDSTCIWFAQKVGFQTRIIDYYENNGQDLAHYADIIAKKRYRYDAHFLPHDAAHERLGMGSSIQGQLKTLGVPAKILKIGSVAARIELGRDLLKTAFVDEQKCRDGLHALMNYQYEWDENRNKFKDKPLHDWASDGADAFGYLAQAILQDEKKSRPKPRRQNIYVSNDWMAS